MKIGITISGGGYRATTYSLGVFSYLDHIKLPSDKSLLENVEALSTVSGGSITGITYALSIKRNKKFDEYFRDLYQFITSFDLVSQSINNFVNPNTKKSLIEGFSKSYNDILFVADKENNENKNYTIDDIVPDSNSHLKYVCINATDFNTGTPFRFIAKTNEPNNNMICGNFFYRLDQYINQIPLSTALAASSCFPGGFEPILIDLKKHDKSLINKLSIEFEKEYLRNPNLYNNKEEAKNIFIERHSIVSLMDGGIVDNQGIKSLINYERHLNTSSEKKGLDLMMVIDVSSPSFTAFEEKRHTNVGLLGNVKMINILYLIFTLTCFSYLALAYSIFIKSIEASIISTLFSTLFSTLSICLIAGKNFTKKIIQNNGFDFGDIKKMNILTPNTILQLGINRFNSVNILVGNVFMKHLRRLNLAEFFSNSTYRNKTIHNAIYQLKVPTQADKNVRMPFLNFPLDSDNEKYRPSDEIAIICTHAFDMGTTLWVSKNDDGKRQIQNVLIAGQVTTCANLFMHYYKIESKNKSKLNSESKTELNDEEKMIFEKCKEDLIKFNENPYWMLEKLLGEDQVLKSNI